MPGSARAALPEEFYDITSDMLLLATDPQYLYANMCMGAMGISLAAPSEIGLPGRGVGGVGADYSTLDRGQLMLSSPMFTEVIAAKFDFTALPGSTIRVNRPKYSNTTYTKASRQIKVGSTISTVPIRIESEQTNLTLYNFGGPYDQDNSRVAPYAINAFDTQMGVHNLVKMHGLHIVRDFRRWLEFVHVGLFDLAATAVMPDGMSAVNDATSVGSFPMTLETLSRAEQQADSENMPVFSDGSRAAVLTTLQVKQLKDDSGYQRAAQQHPLFNQLFQGQYVTTVGNVHVFKSNTLTITNNSSSVPIHYGHFFGPGVLLEGLGRPPRIIPHTDDNFAQQVKFIWNGDFAFEMADNSFVKSIRTSA